MTNIENAVIARLKVQGEIFEILVDCNKALEFKMGKSSLDDAVVTNNVFKDVKQGEKASEIEMKKLFGTSDFGEVASIIIRKGDIQLTTEHRNKLREQKKKQIIDILHKNAVDPKTGLPHPPQRIENALDQAHVKIDEFKKAEDQLQEIISQLRPIIPLSIEKRVLEVKIPSHYASRSYSLLKNIGDLQKDSWNNDGSLTAHVVIPAGMQERFEDELNKLTHGDIEIRVIKKE